MSLINTFIARLKDLTNTQLVSIFLLYGFLLYSSSLLNGFVADDNVYILSNPQIRNFNLSSFFLGSSYFTGDVNQLSGIYYKPLFTLVTSALFIISHGTPFLFHLFQLMLHLVNSILVFQLFRGYFKKLLAYILAFIFMVHPGNVESVVYVADLQDVMYPFFGLSALLLLRKQMSKQRISVVILLLLASLLSKESGILFLFSSFLLLKFKFKQGFLSSCAIPFTIFVTYLILRFGVAKVLINHQAIAPIMEASLFVRILTLPKIIFSYFMLFVFPKDLSWGQHWLVDDPTFSNFWVPLIVVILVFLILAILYFRLRQQRSVFVIFLGMTLAGLLLHSQLLPLDFTFAERWFYFIGIGFLGLTGVMVTSINTNRKLKTAAYLFLTVGVIIFSIRTFVRIPNWKDDFTLASHDIVVNPDSLALNNNLGYVYIQKGNYIKAKYYLTKSANVYPDTSSLNNLAFVQAKLGEKSNAIATYKKALTLGNFYLTYQNYTAELIRQGRNNEAITVLKSALELNSGNPKLWLLYSVASYNLKDIDGAKLGLSQADKLSPGISSFLLQKMQNNEKIEL